ncbi:MAG: transglutaminase family protein [Gemmataceae bacterium]
MGVGVALTHVTRYSFDRPVSLQPHVIRLRPAPHTRTPITSYSLSIEPTTNFINWQQDPYGNYHARLVFPKPASELIVTVDLTADLTPINPFDFFVEESAQEYPFAYDPPLARELVPYLETLPAGPRLQALIENARRRGEKICDFLVFLNRMIQQHVAYTIRLETGVQTPEETLESGRGSCRDSAWLLVQLLRQIGLAARFVSGYLIQLVADEKPLEGPEGPSADFTDLHAWAEVYIPGAGWIGLDPTSGLMTAEGHIPLACTAEPQSAAPITGSFSWTKRNDDDEVKEEFQFQMAVSRISERPRVTKPYSEEGWQAINQLGHRIDADLLAGDVRLTMGGEPTFVSIDDRDSPEWNTAALGENKKRQGITLLKRLRDRFAPGALLHFGQGKWYPGEPLPRWAFGCYWRKDGQSIWNEPALYADEDRSYGLTLTDAENFAGTLAKTLGVDSQYVIPGFEDCWYYLWKERRLPVNVRPNDNRLNDPEERVRLAKLFESQWGSPVGMVLPIRKSWSNDGNWESSRWSLRTDQLLLIPGDSPMGYRLPLDSLEWEEPSLRQTIMERDPFAPRGPLSDRTSRELSSTQLRIRPSAGAPTPAHSTIIGQETGRPRRLATGNLVRTAICIEPRNGILHVFMPPLQTLEDYLELLQAVEATAAKLDRPVRIEGYRPPYDYRVNHLSVTPDPGVIEVNVHPAQSWGEVVEVTTALYEEARQARLCTEKFMLDGRHTGTGGGNHVVMGGPSPADSPFLRRPDLLKSILGFWHNHPSLSYMFSGLFIGPTSQHPRVDEARHDALRELEIAFSQLNPQGTTPAWMVDRLFRHLLTDLTGNTHRAEFCIDKLYNPDSAEGRRGLLELRSFEMPPHSQMSCAQQLFMRAIVSWFWKKPYRRKLVRWGTALHDQFMLPHFVEQDFADALAEMREQSGYPIEESWFAPHREFRFPLIGVSTNRGIRLELRTAIEPWHVLGEESTSGGTSRYVDSSVERVQVKVNGMNGSRFVLTCNGRRVPLHPTGTNGEFVAGIRYRAWQPPSCLHPTIPVHAPLVFDLLDTWNERNVGGCRYHVSHPGGRAQELFPVNSLEAESRRIARFFAFGHTPGNVKIPHEERDPEFPLTLDLRRPASG